MLPCACSYGMRISSDFCTASWAALNYRTTNFHGQIKNNDASRQISCQALNYQELLFLSLEALMKTQNDDVRLKYVVGGIRLKLQISLSKLKKLFRNLILIPTQMPVSSLKTLVGRLIDRVSSHIILECALQTHPNITIIGEEVAAKKLTLKSVTDYIVDVISRRSELGY
ncbi:uncharacterized protein LOC120069750 isoform X4 [Benincasa hispida]|uniref:uncharacterized protein LOC120069750 isoform X4 n=1 Tax=Benincasa hispida TaxID=102211 RepID=UPI001902A340|nr:uncharacterized protein LOC120069750 isoform X4 [Benincasa hispida]